MAYEVTISPSGQVFSCVAGESLLQALLSQGIFVDNPCNGKGVCGKCRVRVLSGRLSPLTDTEKRFLKPEELEAGVRLSCMTTVQSDLVVELLQQERKHRVLTTGHIPAFTRDSFSGGYGLAVDIGTTTVVTSLVELCSGRELANASAINAQKQFGLDVLTRITYEYEHPETGISQLQTAIVQALNEMLHQVCASAGIDRSELREIHVAANCTMTHMLLGVDARSIGKFPYTPVFTQARWIQANQIGLDVPDSTRLYCLPHVSAYIGADIVAGAYVCQLHRETGNVLFIDIGTNGEIVLASKGRILCCSCAAGPALEGMNISSGMRAAEGAVEDVHISPQGVTLDTIGDLPPVGLCGSGILAAVRELVHSGILKQSGVFLKPDRLPEDDYRRALLRMNGSKREFLLCREPELLVTQSDVRQVQLAKGAILSGFLALLQEAGIQMQQLDKVIIAGQFGSHLPVDSLTGTGILPVDVQDKLEYVGNSSKTGAYMSLLSHKARTEIEQLAERMEYLELAETENYEALFTASLSFPKQ